ncbi:MAG TPA: hypothetical protein VFG39_08065 [Balneolaceae bacterium]|nr:hypothetical protein [Balneolaceae bacterium]
MKRVIFLLTVLSSLIIISCNDKGLGPDPDNKGGGEEDTSYKITITVSPSQAGTVSPSADTTYAEGDSVSFQANPAEGYEFVKWTGDVSSTENPLNITVDQDYELIANFSKKKYELSVQVAGEGTVIEEIIQGKSKEYEHGTVVELTAEADAGWEFVEWQGDVSSTQNPVQVTVDEPKEVDAVFRSLTYGLTLIIRGDGNVIRNPDKDNYAFNETVELTAVPDEGWEFIEWLGAVNSTANSIEITIDGTKEVTAVFDEQSFDLNLDTIGNGTITKSPNRSEYEFGTEVELTANPAEGWEFVEWRGDVNSGQNPVEITIDGTKDVTAVFVEEQRFSLTVDTEGQGSVEKDPDQETYEPGTEVTLTATAAEGWEFVEWTGSVSSTANSIEITMDGPKEVTAVFAEEQMFSLTVDTEGQGSVEKDPDRETYEPGAEVELTATPDEGWEFAGWTGDVSSTTNPLEVTMDESKSITAVFTQQSFSLTVNTDGSGTVTKNPNAPEYPAGTTVDLMATPAEGWEFVEWTGDVEGTANPVQVTMDEPKQVTAVFTRQSFSLTVDTEGEGMVTKNPNEPEYSAGTSVALTATASPNWQFAEWTGDAEGTDNVVQIIMDAPKEVTAVFVETFSITTTPQGNGTITLDPQQERYVDGSEVVASAIPDSGWIFVRWEGDLSGVATPQSLIVDSDKSITAVFEEDEM